MMAQAVRRIGTVLIVGRLVDYAMIRRRCRITQAFGGADACNACQTASLLRHPLRDHDRELVRLLKEGLVPTS